MSLNCQRPVWSLVQFFNENLAVNGRNSLWKRAEVFFLSNLLLNKTLFKFYSILLFRVNHREEEKWASFTSDFLLQLQTWRWAIEEENKTLKTCPLCKIAQYCGQECQRWDFKDKHKFHCIQYFKPQKDLGEKAKKILNEKGHDVDRSSLQVINQIILNSCVLRHHFYLPNVIIQAQIGLLDFPQLFQAPKLFQLNLVWKERRS